MRFVVYGSRLLSMLAAAVCLYTVFAQPAQAEENTSQAVAASAPSQTAQLNAVIPVEERLAYLQKLKAFLEADPLDMAEFERQFEVKFECRAWRDTGRICDYRAVGERWPYAVFKDKSSTVSYMLFGDGTKDSVWINLIYPNDRRMNNCITGTMVQQVFTPPQWANQIGVAKSQGVPPRQALVLALNGVDQWGRRVSLVTLGVAGCTGKLQITVHPLILISVRNSINNPWPKGNAFGNVWM